MLYEDAVAELLSYVAELGPAQARNMVNRAWRNICDSRKWSFLRDETAIYTPALVNTGAATFTLGSTSVTGDVTAAAAWVAIGATDLAYRQIRRGLGPVYNISSFDGVNTLTLENAYGEPTAAGVTYQIQQFYYDAPADFLKWESVVDPVRAYSFVLDMTRGELDRIDPQRGSQTTPHRIVPFRLHPTRKRYQYELWPSPTGAQRYPALYQTRYASRDDGDEFPAAISDAYILAEGKVLAYEWAMANKSRHIELKGVDWFNLRSAAQKEALAKKLECQRQDEETSIQDLGKNYMYPPYPGVGMGNDYWQSHAPMFGAVGG